MESKLNWKMEKLVEFNSCHEERELPIEWQMELGQRLFTEKYPEDNEKFTIELWKKAPKFRQELYTNLEEMERVVTFLEKMDKSRDKISMNVETDHDLWKKKGD
jgi:hypothetical protein